jgi:LPS-assembly lipoprotein
MWWSEATVRTFGLAALMAAAGALGACGFHPLYGKANPEVAPQNTSIKILPPGGPIDQDTARVGQELRNMLYTQLNPKGEPARPKYTLDMKLTESKQSLAIQKTEVATRANLTIDAEYKLQEIATGRMVVSASTRGIASYDIVQSEFANLTAAKDAERRALQGVSDDIVLRISFYFTQEQENPQQPAPPPPPGAALQPPVDPAAQGYPVNPEPPLQAPGYAPPGYGQTGYLPPGYGQTGYLPPAYPAYPAPAYQQPPGYQQPAYAPPYQAPAGAMPPYPGYPSYQPPPIQPQGYQPQSYQPPPP